MYVVGVWITLHVVCVWITMYGICVAVMYYAHTMVMVLEKGRFM